MANERFSSWDSPGDWHARWVKPRAHISEKVAGRGVIFPWDILYSSFRNGNTENQHMSHNSQNKIETGGLPSNVFPFFLVENQRLIPPTKKSSPG